MSFTSPHNRIFALVDGNSFYASCEKIYRPDLKDKPVVVLKVFHVSRMSLTSLIIFYSMALRGS
jgi:hypothetical protein